MKLKLSVVIACTIAEVVVVAIGYVSIINETPADIHVRVTSSDTGGDSFHDVSPGNI